MQQLGGGIHTEVKVYPTPLVHVKGGTYTSMMMFLHFSIVAIELLVILWNVWSGVLVKLQGWIMAKQREYDASNYLTIKTVEMEKKGDSELSFVENLRNAVENTMVICIDFIVEFLVPWLSTNGLWIIFRIIWVVGMCRCITQLMA